MRHSILILIFLFGNILNTTAQITVYEEPGKYLIPNLDNDFFEGDEVIACTIPPPPTEPSLDYWWHIKQGIPPVYRSKLHLDIYLNGPTSVPSTQVHVNARKIYTDEEDFRVASPNSYHPSWSAALYNQYTADISNAFNLGGSVLPGMFSLPEKLHNADPTGAIPEFDIYSAKGTFFLGFNTDSLVAGNVYTLSWGSDFWVDFPTTSTEYPDDGFWVWNPDIAPIIAPQLTINSVDLIDKKIEFTISNTDSADILFMWFFLERCVTGVTNTTFTLTNNTTGSISLTSNVDITISDDPNAKCVEYPYNGVCETSRYTIRFVNEGKAPADGIVITDWLPDNVDPTTLRDVEFMYRGERFRPNKVDISTSEVWDVLEDRYHQTPGPARNPLITECTKSVIGLDEIFTTAQLDTIDSTGFYLQKGHRIIFVFFTAADDNLSTYVLPGYDDTDIADNWPHTDLTNTGYVRYKVRTPGESIFQGSSHDKSIVNTRHNPSLMDIHPAPAYIEFDCRKAFIKTGLCQTGSNLAGLGNPIDSIFMDTLQVDSTTRIFALTTTAAISKFWGHGYGKNSIERILDCDQPTAIEYPEVRQADNDLMFEITVSAGTSNTTLEYKLSGGDYKVDDDGMKVAPGSTSINIDVNDLIGANLPTGLNAYNVDAALYKINDEINLALLSKQSATRNIGIDLIDLNITETLVSGDQYLLRVTVGVDVGASDAVIDEIDYAGKLRSSSDWNRRSVDVKIKVK